MTMTTALAARTTLFIDTTGTLEALALSDHEWRIENPVLTEQEGFGLVGFVRKAYNLYEATRFGRPLEWAYFATLEDAVASLM